MKNQLKTFRNVAILFNTLRYFYDKQPEKGLLPDYKSLTGYLEKLKYYHGSGVNCYYVADLRKLRIVEVGGSLEKMTGSKPEQLVNRNFAHGLRFFSLHDIPDILQCMIHYHQYVYNKPVSERLLVKGSVVLNVKNGRGGYFKGLLQAAPLALDTKGHVAMMFTSVTDISHFNINAETLKIDIIDESDKEDIRVINIIDRKTQVVLHLSDSEIRVFEHLKEGKSTKEIADVLFLSEHTINNHRKNMLRKTNAKNTAELIKKVNPYML